jgi:hypothetical protein
MPIAEADLRDAGFEAFVAFLFERPVVPIPRSGSDGPEPWYWNVEPRFQHLVVAGYYIRLFGDPVSALVHYTGEQLEQGFWAIQGTNLECSAGNLVWAPELPLVVRERLVRSMAELFEVAWVCTGQTTQSARKQELPRAGVHKCGEQVVACRTEYERRLQQASPVLRVPRSLPTRTQ